MVLLRPVAPDARRKTILLLVVVAVVAALLGWTAKAAVDSHDQDAVWHTGRGYVGYHQFSVCIHGSCYGTPPDEPIRWIDTATDTEHDGSWPACLKPTQTQEITFATATVNLDGATEHPVIEVRC